MPVSLSFGDRQSYQINESRVNRMMSSDRAEATHMGLWDRFKDLFRSDKKSEALNELYNLIHGNDTSSNTVNLGPVSTFEKLKSMAGAAYQELFSYHESNGNIEFHIDRHHVHTESYRNIIKNSKFSDGTELISGYRQKCHDFCNSNAEDFQLIHKKQNGKPIPLQGEQGEIGGDERAEYSEYFFNKSNDGKTLSDFFKKIELDMEKAMRLIELVEPSDIRVVELHAAYVAHANSENV